jgi:hypothetical protein
MYPISAPVLELHEVAKHWARDMPQRPPVVEVFATLVASILRRELATVARPRKPEIRQHLLASLVRLGPHPGLAIFADSESLPKKPPRLFGGGESVDLRTFVILPEDQSKWSPEIIAAACEALANVGADQYADTFSQGFRIVLRMQEVSRDDFEPYCEVKGHLSLPFMHPEVLVVKAAQYGHR